jgi:hypothetical protein
MSFLFAKSPLPPNIKMMVGGKLFLPSIVIKIFSFFKSYNINRAGLFYDGFLFNSP